MPRPRSIWVDDDALLASIRRCYAQSVAEAKQASDDAQADYNAAPSGERYTMWSYLAQVNRDLKTVSDAGIKYDIPRFAGREVTASERIRYQDAIRRLEARGLVSRYGTWIMPMPEDAGTDCVSSVPQSDPPAVEEPTAQAPTPEATP